MPIITRFLIAEIFQQQKANADPGARSRVPQGNPSISTLGGVFFILVILICAIVARVYCEARPQRTTTTQEPGSSPSKHDGPSREEREKEIRNVLNENVFSSSQQPSTVQDQQKIVTTDSTAANIERDQCVICLQSFDSGEVVLEPVRQDCHHVFHKICIITWLIRHDECPYCRRDLFHFDDSCQV